jgi:hypothetical protein
MTGAPPIGHNGGPPLGDELMVHAPHYCRFCIHWSPPPEAEERDYERFQLGLSRRRVRRPTGYCVRVLRHLGNPSACSATVAKFSCLYFSP